MTIAVAREDEWVSIAQAAEGLGVHPRTLRRYIKDGRLSVLRLSAQVVRIRPEEIAQFTEENIKIVTGTGVCYVPRVPEPSSVPTGTIRRSKVRPPRR